MAVIGNINRTRPTISSKSCLNRVRRRTPPRSANSCRARPPHFKHDALAQEEPRSGQERRLAGAVQLVPRRMSNVPAEPEEG
jgi:hypothetical protein